MWLNAEEEDDDDDDNADGIGWHGMVMILLLMVNRGFYAEMNDFEGINAIITKANK